MGAVKTIEEIAKETPIVSSFPEANKELILADAVALSRAYYPKENESLEYSRRIQELTRVEQQIKHRELDNLRCLLSDSNAYLDAVVCGAAYSMLIRHHLELSEFMHPYRAVGNNQRRRRMGLYFHACLHNFNEPYRLEMRKEGYHEEARPQAEIGVELWDSIYHPESNLDPHWFALAAELHFRRHRLRNPEDFDGIETAFQLVTEGNARLDYNPDDVDSIESATRNMYLWTHDRKKSSTLQEYAKKFKELIEKVHRFAPKKRFNWDPLPV